MLSSSHPKIHEPRVTGVSPVPRTSDSARKLRNTRVLAVASFHEPLPLTKLGATHERRPVRGQD